MKIQHITVQKRVQIYTILSNLPTGYTDELSHEGILKWLNEVE